MCGCFYPLMCSRLVYLVLDLQQPHDHARYDLDVNIYVVRNDNIIKHSVNA